MRIFYRSEQTAPVQGFSPSAGKPALVMESWAELGLATEVLPFDPVTAEALERIHDPAYVRGVLAGTRPNGFDTCDAEIARSFLFTSGSLCAAALDALKSGRVAVSPTSGFHHARFAGGGAFCTFNALVLAALAVLDAGARRVGILDLDHHYGNGTDDIIRHLGLGDRIHNETAGRFRWKEARQIETDPYFQWLDRSLAGLKSWGADLVIAQLGADASVFDPLGGNLDDAGLLARDRRVFEFCHANGLPLAWNLAGGYQTDRAGTIRPVLDLHDRSAAECARVYDGVEVKIAAPLRLFDDRTEPSAREETGH